MFLRNIDFGTERKEVLNQVRKCILKKKNMTLSIKIFFGQDFKNKRKKNYTFNEIVQPI